ncbi:MAG: 2-polyprenyl-6-methoxyphenol hydroxylase [Rhizobiales bacterium]|nr:2-polyprenyl-6-methoxyphenol hydroxylase [Hyphomicrobiales bacterium]
MDTDVLIVGGGPTGLTLANDLGLRGVRCMLIDQKPAPQFLPKMERCNARTMEIFRRMGLVDKVRAAGLRADAPMDVFLVLSCVEPPLLRFPFPSVAEFKEIIANTTDGSQPLEPYQLISQYTVEPLLKAEAEKLPSVSVRFGFELLSFEQDAESVTARVKALDETISTIRAKYLAACDGGASVVRRKLGIKLSGEANILELRQALYYCEDLYERIPIGQGRHYHAVDKEGSFLIVQDSTKHFTLHAVVENDADMAAQFEKVVAMPVKYEMLYVGRWRQNLLLAERYQEGRVFMAGDAVHLVIPTGGLGMNSGVGDAIDLSWKLAATLQGWGGPKLLESYETERRTVGHNNVQASTYASLGRRKWRGMYGPEMREKTPAGDAARAELIKVADVEQRKSNEMIGAELAYHYAGSPLIWPEPGQPPYDFREYVPTTFPGVRLPHVWLKDGTAMQDRIGYDHGYTLLRLGGSAADTSGLERAFKAHSAPFRALDIDDAHARDVYGHDLILLRPDMHIVWRGQRAPDDPRRLAAMATGH